MVRITEELLRKRAEHNEGILTTLEEVSLHQQEIEKIENLDKLCRHIQILLLQNNIIEKLENLAKLKELVYLNVALNNIKKIEGLQGCENLKKIDLTCNFIDLEDLEESLNHLKPLHSLKELYLMGNPCSDWPGCRELTIALIDSIEVLDGKDVTHSERILAKQKLNDLLIDLNMQIELKKLKESSNPTPPHENAHTRENRKKMYLELAKEKEEKERLRNPEKFKEPKKESSIYYPNGEFRQCNEGKYEYKLIEWDDPDYTAFELKVPKFMDTSLIDVNLYPKCVSVRIKGKLTQLRLNDEILVEKSNIKRSTITGVLEIKMPKVNPNEILRAKKKDEAQKKPEEKNKSSTNIKDKKEEVKEETKENANNKEENKKKKSGKKKEPVIDYSLDDIPDLEQQYCERRRER